VNRRSSSGMNSGVVRLYITEFSTRICLLPGKYLLSDRLWAAKLSRYVTGNLGQVSLLSLRGKSSIGFGWG